MSLYELYGYTSESASYLCEDYPYGRVERCRIRYWIETDPKKGTRFVSQTEHPRTKRWNNPKRSTYSKVAGAMYLDAANHVQYRSVHEYTNEHEALTFAQDFPQTIAADTSKSLLVWASMKAKFSRKMSTGEAYFTVNKVRQETSDAEKERHAKEADVWESVVRVIKGET